MSSLHIRGEAADAALIEAIEDGLPLVERPFAALGATIGLSETQVIERLRGLLADGTIKRFGVVVRHRELGYGANAMAVWDLPEAQVDEFGPRIAAFPFVTLCYRRPRRPPDWPYNLFTMIHGRSREAVLAQVESIRHSLGLDPRRCAALFSRERFKQRGAHYGRGDHRSVPAPIAPGTDRPQARMRDGRPEAVL